MRLWSQIVIVLSLLGCSHVPPAQIPDPSYAGQSAIVSDIDGTLTPTVPSVYEVRPDAVQALRALSDKG
jgi:trehalose-6-phosphatase